MDSVRYRQARWLTETLRIPHHVDHIVPLVHELVCGLHCEANLQVLTAQQNLEKNNSFNSGEKDGSLNTDRESCPADFIIRK